MEEDAKLKVLQKRRQEIFERLENCRREMAQCHEDLRRLYEEEDGILLSESEANAPSTSAQQRRSASEFSNFSGPNRLRPAPDPDGPHIDLKSPNKRRGTPHPKGAPSIVNMAQQILWETRTSHPHGLTGGEIVKMINDKWWPGVSENSILPKLYKWERENLIFLRKYDRWFLR